MCMILDTNCFCSFFDSKSVGHKIMKPAFDWVMNGDGKLMYGGSKYMDELKKVNKYHRIFIELQKACKAIPLSDGQVDIEEAKVRKMETNPDFDDPHLAALVIVGRCRIICSMDKRSVKFLKKKSFYPKGIKTPLFYMGRGSKGILTRNNIAKSNLNKYY